MNLWFSREKVWAYQNICYRQCFTESSKINFHIDNPMNDEGVNWERQKYGDNDMTLDGSCR